MAADRQHSIEGEPLWVEWLKRNPAFEASFMETLAVYERQAITMGLAKSDATVAEKYEATGVFKVVTSLRNMMTMYQREAEANAARKTRR